MTIGYVKDFNEILLTDLADACQGNAYHVATADQPPASRHLPPASLFPPAALCLLSPSPLRLLSLSALRLLPAASCQLPHARCPLTVVSEENDIPIMPLAFEERSGVSCLSRGHPRRVAPVRDRRAQVFPTIPTLTPDPRSGGHPWWLELVGIGEPVSPSPDSPVPTPCEKRASSGSGDFVLDHPLAPERQPL